MAKLDFNELDIYLQKQNGWIIHQLWFETIHSRNEAKKSYKKLKLYRDSWYLQNPSYSSRLKSD
jgi:hypothetical protein